MTLKTGGGHCNFRPTRGVEGGGREGAAAQGLGTWGHGDVRGEGGGTDVDGRRSFQQRERGDCGIAMPGVVFAKLVAGEPAPGLLQRRDRGHQPVRVQPVGEQSRRSLPGLVVPIAVGGSSLIIVRGRGVVSRVGHGGGVSPSPGFPGGDDGGRGRHGVATE